MIPLFPGLPGGHHPCLPGADGATLETSLVSRVRPAAEAGAGTPARRGLVPGVPAPGTAVPSPDVPPEGDGTAPSAVPGAPIGSDAPGAAAMPLRGREFRDAVKRALAEQAKAARNRRGKHRAAGGYRPGSARRMPPGSAG